MKDIALLVIDMQAGLLGGHPFQEETILSNIVTLLLACRQNSVEVIFVRHDGGEGSELEAGSTGWQIHTAVTPLKNEKIFEKRYCSAFIQTDLESYLNSLGIRKLVIVGMRTEYCLDATVKSAFERGYMVMVPTDTTTTYSNPYLSEEAVCRFYEREIWVKSGIRVIPFAQVWEELRCAR